MRTMAKKKPMSPEEVHQVLVRMPHKTWQALEEDARRSFRTINMHILWLIEERLNSLRDDREGD